MPRCPNWTSEKNRSCAFRSPAAKWASTRFTFLALQFATTSLRRTRTRLWVSQKDFYYMLGLPRDVTFKELRLAYRLRRMELQKENASKVDLAAIERAYNLLADPNIRAEYDALLRNCLTPVAFPYSGFGSLLVQGERSRDNGVFFANRILAFMPERRRRTVSVPLRKLDYFEDYAILRDRNRKIEVLLDHELLPLRWDPTWSRWRHLISATVEVAVPP